MVSTILIAAAVVLGLAVWLALAGIRSLRTFVRSFWPH
jgi:hypothetical protein